MSATTLELLCGVSSSMSLKSIVKTPRHLAITSFSRIHETEVAFRKMTIEH